MKILINGVGGPTPRSIAHTLLNYSQYNNYDLIGIDCDKYAIGLYQNDIFKKTFIIPKASDSSYWETIEKIIKSNEIDLALVQPEQEVLEWSKRAVDGQLPCKTLIPEFELVKLLIDKSLMTATLAPHNVVPESIVVESDQKNFKEIEEILGYPFWIRSVAGSSGLGSLKVENIQALKNWMLINPNVQRFLASSYLPGRNLACKMLYFEGDLVRAACGERVNYIMSKVAPSGITGNTSFGRLLNSPDVFSIAKKALDVMFQNSGSRRHGFFTVDLKEDKFGKPLITEVNVRHVAFTGCFAAGGANFVEDTIRLLNGDSKFDKKFKLYEFEKDLIFLRDVDSLPVLMKETQLLNGQ